MNKENKKMVEAVKKLVHEKGMKCENGNITLQMRLGVIERVILEEVWQGSDEL